MECVAWLRRGEAGFNEAVGQNLEGIRVEVAGVEDGDVEIGVDEGSGEVVSDVEFVPVENVLVESEVDDLVGEEIVTVHDDGSEEVQVNGQREYVIEKLERLPRRSLGREDKLKVHWKGGETTVQPIAQLQEDVPELVQAILHPTSSSGRAIVDPYKFATFVNTRLPFAVCASVRESGIAFDAELHGAIVHTRTPLYVSRKIFRVREAMAKVRTKKQRLSVAVTKRDAQEQEFKAEEAKLLGEVDAILKSTSDPESMTQKLADLCAASGVL